MLIEGVKNATEGYDLFCMATNAIVKTTATGNQYLSLKLSDKTGSIDGKYWDFDKKPIEPNEINGNIVKLRGKTTEYNGNAQITIQLIRVAAEGDEYDVADIVPVAPLPKDTMLSDMKDFTDSIIDPDYKKVVAETYERYGEVLAAIPAAKSVHHAFLHGLLMHTANMLKMASFMCGFVYADKGFLNRDLLLTGAFLHDLGKIEEFSFSQLGLVSEYSLQGKLLGHLFIGTTMVRDMCQKLNIPEEKALLLEHMLASHHGIPEYGAITRPQIAEAELLSQIDMLDAKMEIVRETLAVTPIGAWSESSRPLDGRAMFKHFE